MADVTARRFQSEAIGASAPHTPPAIVVADAVRRTVPASDDDPDPVPTTNVVPPTVRCRIDVVDATAATMGMIVATMGGVLHIFLLLVVKRERAMRWLFDNECMREKNV